VRRKPKKKWKKRRKEKRYIKKPQHVTSHVFTDPPTMSQRHVDLRVWSYSRRSYIFQVSSKYVQRFLSPGKGSKFANSHYFGYWLLQQLARCKPWYRDRRLLGVLSPRERCEVLRWACLSVGLPLSVCPLAYLKNTRWNFTKFSIHVTCDRGSVLLWRLCNTLCTSGFVDDVMFYIVVQIQIQAWSVRHGTR